MPRPAPQVLPIFAGRGGAGQDLLFCGAGRGGAALFSRGGAGRGGAPIPGADDGGADDGGGGAAGQPGGARQPQLRLGADGRRHQQEASLSTKLIINKKNMPVE